MIYLTLFLISSLAHKNAEGKALQSTKFSDVDSVWRYTPERAPTFFKAGHPSLYILFVNNEPLMGYCGGKAYKVGGYNGCWFFNLQQKESNHYVGIIRPRNSHFSRDELDTIHVFRSNNQWVWYAEAQLAGTSVKIAKLIEFPKYDMQLLAQAKGHFLVACNTILEFYFDSPLEWALRYPELELDFVNRLYGLPNLNSLIHEVTHIKCKHLISGLGGSKSTVHRTNNKFLLNKIDSKDSPINLANLTVKELFETLEFRFAFSGPFNPKYTITSTEYDAKGIAIQKTIYYLSDDYLKVDNYYFFFDHDKAKALLNSK